MVSVQELWHSEQPLFFWRPSCRTLKTNYESALSGRLRQWLILTVENLETGPASLMMRPGFSAIEASSLLNGRMLTLEQLWKSQMQFASKIYRFSTVIASRWTQSASQ
tara:strand:- start:120778 stop:121101 length:324 start_codon:yes stop_codon:yes gene_type:complete